MPFPRVENIREYTLDMEQWLIAEIIYEPSSYSKIRRIVSPGHFWLVHNSVFLQAIENLFIAHGTEGIHPVGIAHEVRPADADETRRADETPMAYAERVARDKAHTIALADPEALVIAADTIVVVDGDVLGKPADVAQARTMLGRLSGRLHIVHTAVAVSYNGRMVSAVESVYVTVRPLSDHDIAAYVATGEPLDKAGAYGIQGFGATSSSVWTVITSA